jgi:hypothetical protein
VTKCCYHMLANMDHENVLDVLALADALGLVKVKSKAVAFICTIFQVEIY